MVSPTDPGGEEYFALDVALGERKENTFLAKIMDLNAMVMTFS